MKTLNQKIKHSIEVKKSNFLSFILPYIEFEEQMQALKTKHPKAVHFVFAYRFIFLSICFKGRDYLKYIHVLFVGIV